MTFVNLLKRKRDRVGLEPVFDFQWHPLKNKTHLICDFIPSWDVQFGKIHKFTVAQQLQQAKKDFIGIGELLGIHTGLEQRALTSVSRLLHC